MRHADSKYFAKSAWRRTPTHNYGFILDAGVHCVAVLRLLIGEDVADTVMAYSHTASKYLPAPDSLHGVVRLKSGAVGSFMYSVGSTFQGLEYAVSCEHGSVAVVGDKVTVVRPDGKEERDFEFRFGGVEAEVRAWAEAVIAGQPDPLQSPEQALADLEFLEGLLLSAAEDGKPRRLKLQ